MYPIEFSKSNVIYAKDQYQYLSLPAYKSEDGCVVSCWRLSLKERIQLLFNGRLFLSLLTFNNPLQPIKIGTTFEEVK